MNQSFLEVTREMEQNQKDGGVCGIFDLIDELKFAFAGDKELQERVLTTIKPDNLLKKAASI